MLVLHHRSVQALMWHMVNKNWHIDHEIYCFVSLMYILSKVVIVQTTYMSTMERRPPMSLPSVAGRHICTSVFPTSLLMLY